MVSTRAFLLDIGYAHGSGVATSSLSGLRGKTFRLVLKRESDGKVFRLFDDSFEPYFYLLPREGVTQEQILKVTGFYRGTNVAVARVEEVERKLKGEIVKLFKVYAKHPGHVPVLASELKQYGERFEHQVHFVLRYLLDKKLQPLGLVEVKHSGKMVMGISAVADSPLPSLRVLAFDIETYNPGVKSDPRKDPCLMISYATNEKSGVISYGKKFSHDFVEVVASEKAMLERFCEIVRENHVDVIATYNGDEFDLPFLRERAKVLNADFRLGRDRALPRTRKKGIRNASSLGGRIHFDAYPVVAFLNFIGAFKLQRLTLQDAVTAITGKPKADIVKMDIHKIWDSGLTKDLDYLAFYNRDDSIACLAVTNYSLPLQIEMARLTGNLVFDTSRASAMPLVEPFIMKKALERGELIPSKPAYSENDKLPPVEGAFVKIPNPGVYENIAVLDFKSLYPSIIISYNVGPDSYNCDCCKSDGFVSPQGHRFCKKKKSIIAETLSDILDSRFAIQKKMKTLTDKESDEYKQLYARQWSLKILANSVYGLTLNPRFRWYTREGGESTTAWARQYIQEVNKKAEETGFEVIYNDTDSIMLLYKTENSVLEFRDAVNKTLPERMELELEDFYTRGLFVAKKGEAGKDGKGARKKYALINKEGKIKIRGFELVRRDWSKVAREVQRSVLEILLKEGNVDKAVALVRKTVAELQSGKVPLDDLVILTQLRKSPKDYAIMSPEVSAYTKAINAGIRVPEAVVMYVVTSKGKSISEKAFVREMAQDYDADYYINHQLMPAVLKILAELGVTEDDLLTNSKQHTLGSW
ncbi:MAG: DNA-directed DNA polymerase [Candidatus Micrarchaeota archaeon]|nr:DNA-directed DNA polymerase [Candidatus Micrarchaeota archaeon]